MVLVDTHSHLFLEHFNDDIAEVIKRAKNNGITRIFLPNINKDTIQPMLDLERDYPDQCFPMIGLHPSYVKEDYLEQLALLPEWLNKQKFYGIGETGIDLYWDKTYLAQQQESFTYHVKMAKTTGLPLIIHARDSFDEIFEIIDRENDETLTGIFHSFTGTQKQAQKIMDYGGFVMGINGIITFKKAGLDKVLRKVDISHIVLETDSPYLAPTPYRGKRNESSYLSLITEKLSEVYSLPLEEIASITTSNALKIFNMHGQ